MSHPFTLSNGVTIPSPGFGTYLMPEEPATVDAIVQALRLGYRHIDTAYFYGNETCVGEAIRASGLPREEIFVTSKVWNTDRGYQGHDPSRPGLLRPLPHPLARLCGQV